MIITFLIISCLVSAFVTFGLGVFVYTKNPKSDLNRLFFATMLAATYWAFGEFLIWYPGSYDSFFFWLKASSLWPFAIALMFHFVLAFTRNPLSKPEKVRELTLFLYAPAAVFSLLGIFTNAIFIIGAGSETGFVYLPTPGSLISLAEILYLVFLMASAIFFCFVAWRKSSPGKIRRQNRLLTAAVAIMVFFGGVSGVLFPSYGLYFPNVVFIGIVIFSLIIVYAIIRYGLFTLSPETAVPDLIRMMPDGLILADMNGRIITGNASAAHILGAPEKEFSGSPVEKYLPEPSYSSLRQSILDQGHVLDFEVIIDPVLNKTISISGSPVKDPEGENAGFILIIRDITGRKASENALAVANEKISLLTQLTRHDINNLITGLDGYLLLLQEKKAGPDEDEYINSCMEIVKKIGFQLQFTREYQDIGLHNPLWLPLGAIIDRAKSDLSPHGITITATISEVEIYADPMVVKVIYNILENAIRHGEYLTTINLSTGVLQSRDLLIAIEDDGIGIPDQDKERIFRYGSGKNTGLGLALSRDILSVTGIRLIEIGTWGKGARFEILVPASGWRSL